MVHKKMKKNIKIILLLSLLFLIPNRTKALENYEIKLFEDFTYNDTKIKGFIYQTNLQYINTYFYNDKTNNYYNWIPKNEIIPNYTIIENTNSGNIELHIQMLNYQFYDYGWKYVNYDKKLILQKISWTNNGGYTRNYRWIQRKEDGSYYNFNENFSNMYYMTIAFKYNESTKEWEQITNFYENRTTHKTDFLRNSQEYYKVLLEDKTTYNIKIIQTNLEVINSNYNKIEFEEYKETIIKEEYKIEDYTEEKEEINENEIKLNEEMTKVIKTNLIQISKNESLYNLILITFITTLILIIKNKI